MTLTTVPIFLDTNGIEAITVTAVQLTTQLAAHPRIDEGLLMNPAAWSVTHIRTGYVTADFEHWDPLPTPPDIAALRRYAEWLERHIDLDTHDLHVLVERIATVVDADFCAIVDFYKDHINDWTEPSFCRHCAAPHAHPAGQLCSRCRISGNTRPHDPTLTQDDLVAALTEAFVPARQRIDPDDFTPDPDMHLAGLLSAHEPHLDQPQHER